MTRRLGRRRRPCRDRRGARPPRGRPAAPAPPPASRRRARARDARRGPGPAAGGPRWRRGGRATRPARGRPARSRRRWSCGPRRTRSNGPAARSAAARARAVASVSEPAKAGSQTWSPASAPQATASRRTSSALGRPEGHDGAGATGVAGQGDALGDGAPAVRVHLDADAGADQPAVFEPERLGQRDLLGQGRDRQRVAGGPAHWPAHRPSAAPAGLRGSDAPTRRREPVVVAHGLDDLGAADGDGVEGADRPHPVAVAGQPGAPCGARPPPPAR